MSDSEAFKEEMKRLFGTEEALGVYFILNGTDQKLSAKEYDALFDSKTQWAPLAESRLGNGGDAVCCTHYAKFIYEALPGRVKIYGFKNEDNPSCLFVKMRLDDRGHDFAVVDDRYIVDPWLVHVKGDPLMEMVFDINNPTGFTQTLYGPKKNWKHMVEAEKSMLW